MANFQSITPIKIAQAVMTVSPVLFYTVPDSSRLFLKDINITNTTSGVLGATIYLVPVGGSTGTTNALMYQWKLYAYDLYRWQGVQIMNAGEKIYIEATNTGLTVVASGAQAV